MNSGKPAKKIYSTKLGDFYLNESLSFLDTIESGSIDLIITSPPFALEKDGQAESSTAFIDWLNHYFKEFYRILKSDGNIILELSSIWDTQPVKLGHAYQFVGQLLRGNRWLLLQELFWHNPDLLPTPSDWTDSHRLKDEVSIIWWLAKQPSNKICAGFTSNNKLSTITKS